MEMAGEVLHGECEPAVGICSGNFVIGGFLSAPERRM